MRLLFRFVLVIVFFAVVVWIGAFFYVTPERVTAWVLPHLESRLDRKVVLTQAHVDWFGPGIELVDFQVQDRVGFGSGPFLMAKKAHVRMSLWPVLTGEGKLGELRLEQPVISLVVNARGDLNASDLFFEGRGSKWVLPVDRVRFENATIRYDNRLAGRLTLFEGVTGRVKGDLLASGLAFDGALMMDQFAIVLDSGDRTHISAVDFSFRTVWQAPVLQVEALTVGVGPLVATFTGRVTGLPSVPVMDLQAVNQAVDFERVKDYFIDSGVLSKQAVVTGTGQMTWHISGGWPFFVRGALVATDVGISDVHTLGVSLTQGDVHLMLDGDRVRVHSVRFQAGDSDVSFSGVVDPIWIGRPQVSFTLVSNKLDIDAFRPSVSDMALWGWATPVYAAVGDSHSELLAVLATADFDGSVRADTLVWRGMTIHQVDATVHAKDGTLRLNPLTGQVHDGALKVQGSLVSRKEGGDVVASVSLVNAKADRFVQDVLHWAVPLYGRLVGTTTVTGHVDTTLTWLGGHVHGVVKMPEGRLVKWDLLQTALKDVAQLGVLTADEVPLRDVSVSFDVVGQTVRLDGTQLTAADMLCRINGVGEVNGKLTYALDVDVPASRVNFGGFNLGQALGALFGKETTIPVRVSIGGTTTQPQVTVGMR